MSNLPDDVKSTNPHWDDREYECDVCSTPVEGEAVEKWLASIEPDEDGQPTSDPMLCWECYCDWMGVCVECEGELNQDITCTCIGCDKFGVEQ